MLFEDTWSVRGKNYVRINDGSGSLKISTSYKSEYYLEDSLGEYTSFIDQKKLRRVQGSAYNVDGAYGVKNADYVCIRDSYFGKNLYNKTPNLWYLDIETSVESYKYNNIGVEVRGKNKVKGLVSVEDIQNNKVTDEVFDLELQQWTQPSKSCYHQKRSTGFPEPALAAEPVVLIQFYDTKTKKGYVLGLEDLKYKTKYDFEFEYINCKTEIELFNKFFELFRELDPFIIYGWNADNFDFPYLYNRIKNIGLDVNNLSNYGDVELKTKKLDNGTIQNDLLAVGHWYSDMMVVYKKFIFDTVPSYSLDYIGEKETGISKVTHQNYIKFDDFRLGKYVIQGDETKEQKETLLYKCAYALENNELTKDKKEKYQRYIKEKSYSDFVHYGVIDFVILKGIDEAKNLTGIMIQMAELMGCKIKDTLGTIKGWDAYISAVLMKEKKITPKRVQHQKPDVVGGYVADPKVGLHRWVISSDIASMYPLVGMVAHNMSPETYIDPDTLPMEVKRVFKKHLNDQNEQRVHNLPKEATDEISQVAKKYNISIGLNGTAYSNKQEGLVPTLVKGIYKTRKEAKGVMFKHEKLKIEAVNEQEKTKQQHLEILAFTKQLVLKLAINGLYGSLAQQHFSMFNEKYAQAITMNGRVFILHMSRYIQNALNNLIPGDYGIYNDTDSVVGDTIINTTEGNLKIEDFYNITSGEVDILGEDNYVKNISHLNIKAESLNVETEMVEKKKIKYIMAHKVKKRMYKITHQGKSVTVTEDHSVIVYRDGKYQSVKPKNITRNDYVINHNKNITKSNNFTIEDLGVQENWVYDIEVEDNHNFFGNDILVHNSFYFTIEPFIDRYCKNKTLQEKIEWSDKFYKKIVDKAVTESIKTFSEMTNAYDPGVIGSDREVISDVSVFVAKKKYAMSVRDNEGVRYPIDKPYIKVTGLETKQGGTAVFTKKYLGEAIGVIFEDNEDSLYTWYKNTRTKYLNHNLNQISKTIGVSKIEDPNWGRVINNRRVSPPFGSKAVIASNAYIKKNDLEGTYGLLTPGKVKILYLTLPNPLKAEAFAFNNLRFANLFKDYIDHDLNFEKFFMKPLDNMLKAVGFNVKKPKKILDLW